ncbi:N-acetylglucosamine-specific PTS transporter subunit IIBC [Endozoicomonas sp.]|uniref:N-acetylglucosamine-specific PTS transporter subunit IIBC n=1 Tax=Endozoicomonas sp. TaxID=1892382 RepID=UPI002888B1EC|nr:N-acetylglucosamine-specific PTS transporter subunit IIBC [Endozoicomonas sp.]
MNILGYLQKLGKALMLPIAVLPVAALLLRLGQPDLLGIPFMAEAGNAVFSNLALLFAMGIAVGLSIDGAGAAAIAGAVGFFILKATTATINPDIDMSFFGGIVSGIVAGHSYNRFHAVSLPASLGFFSGKRLVPIMTGLFMLAIGWACGYIWPAIQNGIDTFGHSIAGSGPIGQFVYGTLNRGLIPFGLHHVLNSYFWFGLGEFTDPVTQAVSTGDLKRFFAGDPTAGVFMTGFFPVMMFGLPAAALAMYLTAKKSRRAQVGGVLFSVALTAFLTGITEPLEFMFMFLAPGLYAAHAVLTGVSLVVTNAMGVLSGFGFSAGLFDMVLNWGLATKPWTLVVIGLVFSAIYFCVFYFGIKIFNLKTPGREDDDDSIVEATPVVDTQGMSDNAYKARQFTRAIGGLDNVTNIDACITRLRLTLNDPAVADERVIKALGASGMIRMGEKNLQIILGPQAEIIAGEMKKIAVSEDLSSIQLPGQAQEAAALLAQKEVAKETVKKEIEVKPLDSALFARQCLKVLGGHQNITSIDACITRLRLTLKDASSVSDASIKALGVSAVVRVGDKNLQIVVGPQAEMIVDEMKKIPVTDDLSNAEVSA